MKKLFYQGIFWRGLNYFTQFVLTIAMARLLKAGDSGSVNYLINNLAIVILVTSLSFESSLGYFSAKKQVSQAELSAGALILCLCSMLLSMIACYRLLPGTGPLFFLAILYCGGLVLVNYFTALFNSHYDYLFPNITLSLINLLIAGFCAWSASGDPGVVAKTFLPFYFLAFFVAGLLLAAIYSARYRPGFTIPAAANLEKLLRFALLALAANIVFFLVYRVDYWFVHRYASKEALGNYIQVSKIGQIFLLIPGIIGTVLFTRTARDDSHDHLRELQILSRLLLMCYLLIVLVLLVTGYWLFPLIYGSSFRMMYLPFVLLSPGILSLSTLMLVTAYNGGLGDIRSNLAGAGLALVVIVAGNLLFTGSYGIYAAAAVSSLGYIVYQVYIMRVLAKRNRHLRIADFFIPAGSDIGVIRRLVMRGK